MEELNVYMITDVTVLNSCVSPDPRTQYNTDAKDAAFSDCPRLTSI